MENVMFAKITEEEAMMVDGGVSKESVGKTTMVIGTSFIVAGLIALSGGAIGLLIGIAGWAVLQIGDGLSDEWNWGKQNNSW